MLVDMVEEFQWDDFVILYESPSWLAGISSLLELYNTRVASIKIWRLITENEDFHSTLIKVKMSQVKRIIIQCSTELLADVLKQALEVSLITENHHVIIANLDAQTLQLEPFKFTGANITIFRIVNPDSEKMKEIIEHVNGMKNEANEKCETERCEEENKSDEPLTVLDTHTALIYDGIMLLAEAVRQFGEDKIESAQIDCNNKSSVWSEGLSLVNYMKTVRFK